MGRGRKPRSGYGRLQPSPVASGSHAVARRDAPFNLLRHGWALDLGQVGLCLTAAWLTHPRVASAMCERRGGVVSAAGTASLPPAGVRRSRRLPIFYT